MHIDATLANKTIVVTRPLAKVQNLCMQLEARQAKVVHFPVISIAPLAELESAKKTLQQLANYNLLVFISANAVDYALEIAHQLDINLKHCKLAAVGAATKLALEKHNYQVAISPEEQFSSEALLEHEALQNISQQNILIVRGLGGREHLREELELRGAKVDYLEVYERKLPANRNPIDLSKLCINETRILIYSAESAQNLWSLCTQDEQKWLQNITIVTASARIAKNLSSARFSKQLIIAKNPSDEAILQALSN